MSKPAKPTALTESPKPAPAPAPAPNAGAHLDMLHKLMGERLSLTLNEWATVNRSVEIIRAAITH